MRERHQHVMMVTVMMATWLSFSCMAAANDTETGTRLYDGNAIEQYEKVAEQGDAEIQRKLGLCYLNGEGTAQDYSKAAEWLEKAAQQGDVIAQKTLGRCYYNGQGVEQDISKAVDWYAKAAQQGDAEAQYTLGVFYHFGEGVQQDYSKAVEWYEKAANQGEMYAQTQLGYCYIKGYGVEVDYEKAVEWFEKAAIQGDATAQNNLGLCYENGIGVEQDNNKAQEWYTRAASASGKNVEVTDETSKNLVEKPTEKATEEQHQAAMGAAEDTEKPYYAEWMAQLPDDDLVHYMGRTLESTLQDFDWMTELGGGMQGLYNYNSEIMLISSIGSDHIISGISALDMENSTYTLCGLHASMSEAEIASTLKALGFVQLPTGVWNDSQGNFVSFGSYQHVEFGTHDEYRDIYSYMGANFYTVCQELQLTEWTEILSEDKKDGLAVAWDDTIEVSALYDPDVDNYYVSNIMIKPGAVYCLYGMYPGDTGEAFDHLGFSEGGSGEAIDPSGNVLLFLYSNDEKDPYLSLSTSEYRSSEYLNFVASLRKQSTFTVKETVITAYVGGDDAYVVTEVDEGENTSDSNFKCYSDDPSIASCVFGHWHGNNRNVYITGKKQGTTTIHIEKIDTGEQYTVTVTVTSA